VSIFFLAFLPQFISPAVGKIPLQMITLGGLFFVQALLIFSLVSVFSGMAGEKLLKKSMGSKSISYVKAAVYALLGVRLALLEK
jgi:threonine/homoserine/homoserine lactone efflux protein